MREAKVIVITVSGLNNRLFHSGDVVNEHQFPRGNFEKLIKEGFIQFFRQDDLEPSIQKDTGEVEVNIQPKPEPKQQGEIEREQKIKRLTEQQNWEELKRMGVDVGNQSEITPVQDVVTEDDLLEDKTILELREALNKMKVKFSKNASKAELYDLFRKSKK